MPALPIEGYDTTREDGVTRIRPVYAAPLPVEAVAVQGQGLIPQETPALPVELPVERSSGILADVDRALSGAVRAPFDALDERLFGKSGKKGTYREAIQKFFKTGPSDEIKTGVNRLLGTGGEERYKTWPEKLVVDAITAPGNVLKSETPVTTEELIKPALDVSNLAGTGGLAGVGSGAGVALGSGPIRQAAAAAVDNPYSIDAFHGTNQIINKFKTNFKDIDNSATRSTTSDLGVWLTDNPAIASNYADNAAKNLIPDAKAHKKEFTRLQKEVDRAEKAGDWPAYEKAMTQLETHEYGAINAEPSGQNVMPLRAALKNPLEIDAKNGTMLDVAKAHGDVRKLIIKAKKDGYDGVVFKNLNDNPSLAQGDIGTHYVVFDPANIRSRFAKFDPKNFGKNGLLLSDNQASLGIGAVSKSEKPFYSALERSLGLR